MVPPGVPFRSGVPGLTDALRVVQIAITDAVAVASVMLSRSSGPSVVAIPPTTEKLSRSTIERQLGQTPGSSAHKNPEACTDHARPASPSFFQSDPLALTVATHDLIVGVSAATAAAGKNALGTAGGASSPLPLSAATTACDTSSPTSTLEQTLGLSDKPPNQQLPPATSGLTANPAVTAIAAAPLRRSVRDDPDFPELAGLPATVGAALDTVDAAWETAVFGVAWSLRLLTAPLAIVSRGRGRSYSDSRQESAPPASTTVAAS
ncbi:hypothetical protein HK405_000149, partial [Cladochytrium tenue]